MPLAGIARSGPIKSDVPLQLHARSQRKSDVREIAVPSCDLKPCVAQRITYCQKTLSIVIFVIAVVIAMYCEAPHGCR